MKNIIFNQEGKITKFALWATIAIIVAIVYFTLGSFLGSVQDGLPIRAK